MNDHVSITRAFNGEEFKVLLKDTLRPEDSGGLFPPLEPGSTVVDGIQLDRDVPVTMRDGVTIYTDIYRPAGAIDVPAIVAWSPYGKRVRFVAEPVPGVPEGTISPATKFEGVDPDYWCRRGYAVINPDPRGVGNSEGVVQFFTQQEAQDTADLIEFVAMLDWCNGRVGMAGNSWLAIAQWSAAAQRPPHLACIAPWEGSTDVYRDIFRIGGIKEAGFLAFALSGFFGPGQMEDFSSNIDLHPFHDAYWDEKVPDVTAIEVPAYITGGWSHHFHLKGAIDGYRRIGTPLKWLRIHREFEWPDMYHPDNLQDLGRFFERYLKGHRNGWELTPRVRIDVMDRGDREHAIRRPETDFPLPETEYRKLYLNTADSSLVYEAPERESDVSYDATTGTATFDYTFDRDTELTGHFKLRLWIEVRGATDADLFVAIQKADPEGNLVPWLVEGQPHPGAPGLLRVSRRRLDDDKSTDIQPVQSFRNEQLLADGEIVPVDIALWPSSRFFHAGERLRVLVSGFYTRQPGWFEPFRWDTVNQGQHVIHGGGRYDSHLLVPYIPDPRPVLTGNSITSGPVSPAAT